eukprot:TRINITY_DN9602_c0_g1_i1.p1 TRINITY_DN9602_c0_g1~~TRINITY_DN9602_c0_g1_i1.p1  ORF type:complete len:318 (-),score=113.84 TRINITY_DN9602_c0_g1_i1:6-959(-)
MINTFILPLQELVDSKSRIHTSLNINTETGRLSCRTPNLQNQPALDKDRYKIRKSFTREEGNKLIVADYGQLELRLLAHITNCKSMIDAFKTGGDFHSRTAAGMYSYISDEINNGDLLLEDENVDNPNNLPTVKSKYSTERRRAKVLNFSIAYGKTAIGLAKDWNVSREEAVEIVNRWYNDRPEVRMWQRKNIDRARQTGYTTTIMGRRRNLPEIFSNSRRLQSHAERAAINTPLQGSAADIVMVAMLHIHHNNRLQELGWKMILQIHDELILEGPESSAEEALSIVTDLMRNPFDKPLLIDLVVDATICDNWMEGK